MIDVNTLYANTNEGLDIIFYYYPQARDILGTNKPFKRRNEKDSSAYLKLFGNTYKVTDFGEAKWNGEAQSPIDICMYEEGLSFKDAFTLLCGRAGIYMNEYKPTPIMPDIEKRPAKEDEKDGDIIVNVSPEFTLDQLKILGPYVTKENCLSLNWYVATEIIYVNNGQATVKKPTDKYPIFARRCYISNAGKDPKGNMSTEFFYKIYEPLNQDKSYRFTYAPRGKKPREYTNGLYELRKAYKSYNDRAYAEHEEKNKDKEYTFEKFKEAIICSGERDALCVKSLGFYPIWFNSETYDISHEELFAIKQNVDLVYNIPDIDDTGIERGTMVAQKFWSIRTIWLDDNMKKSKDWRGNSKKDFRDWCELINCNKSKAIARFNKYLYGAKPAEFWNTTYKKDKEPEYSINSSYLHYFLNIYGFYRLKDDYSNSSKLVRVIDNRVEEVTSEDVFDFVLTTVRRRQVHVDIQNLILDTSKLNETTYKRIKSTNLDFTKYTKDTQFMFFENESWEITKEGIKPSEFKKHVWEDDVIPHRVEILDDFFTIKQKVDPNNKQKYWDIDIHQDKCCFLNYIINTSRIYWREELEFNLEDLTPEQAQQYRDANKFNIKGEKLTEVQRRKQVLNLVNKIFTIGYMLHGYKSDSKAWAAFAMDGKPGEHEDECNGRSGKSFFFKALATFMKSVRIDGRMTDVKKEGFLFQNVDLYTDLVYIDDASKYFPIKNFYSLITSEITVNPKYEAAFNIPFEQAPKLAFTTNYIPNDFDSSTMARLLFLVFSDYYHEMTMENGYNENRSIRDDFGKDLLRDYTAEEWNLDLNFYCQCLRFYLAVSANGNIKIQPPMDTIIRRKQLQNMGETFQTWANNYFDPEGDKLNRDLVQTHVYDNYRSFAGANDRTQLNLFTRKVKEFADYNGYIYNPKDLAQSDGRIRKMYGGLRETFIHLRTPDIQAQIDSAAEQNNYEF